MSQYYSESESVSSHSSDSDSKSKSQEDRNKKSHSQQQKRHSLSHSTSSSQSDSDKKSSKSTGRSRSRSTERLKKSKKEKKHSKQRKEKKDKQDKKQKERRQKQKKDQKKDKKKHQRKQEKQQERGSLNEYGKYGLITIEHYHQQIEEFHAWLIECKKQNLETLSSKDEKRLYDDYVELYNTATLSDKQYYDLKIWHSQNKGKLSEMGDHIELDDQTSLKYSRLKRAKELQDAQVQFTLGLMRDNTQIIKDFSDQNIMIEKVQSDYLQGDVEEARKQIKQLFPNLPEKLKQLPTK